MTSTRTCHVAVPRPRDEAADSVVNPAVTLRLLTTWNVAGQSAATARVAVRRQEACKSPPNLHAARVGKPDTHRRRLAFPHPFHALTLIVCLLSIPIPLVASEVPESGIDWQEARQHWAFQPVQAPTLPAVRQTSWPRQRLDYFILAALEGRGMAPNGEVGRAAWLRRMTYALTGLPPTPAEQEAFLADSGEEAFERVVDRLLASPSFGERMASLWMTLARYAEDQAHQVGDDTKHFYPNAHLYRAWVIDAFNRDEPYDEFIRQQLAGDLYHPDAAAELPALGFLGLGPKYYNRGRLDVMADEWEDRVDTVTRTFLGLTVACARCHDHKYDAITTEDYYALAGVFASTRMINHPLHPVEAEAKDEESGEEEKKKKEIDPKETMHIVAEGEAHNLHVLLRGSVDNQGPEVARRFLRVLSSSSPEPFHAGSGRRELAEAIADPDNPLTGRVFVNRIWAMAFGRGLVRTPSNFGEMGAPPTHPELLDDLTRRFLDGGWRVKPLLRELMLSSTYRQASHLTPEGRRLDPDNQYLWRMPHQRLSAEMFRDAVLAVSGRLEWEDAPSRELTDAENHRRTVYARVSRLKLDDYLMQFDYPDANVHSEGRVTTTTPMQKLFLMNSPFMIESSASLAGRLAREMPQGGPNRVRLAYQLLYARPPAEAEVEAAMEFLGGPNAREGGDWAAYVQALMAANEMSYLD